MHTTRPFPRSRPPGSCPPAGDGVPADGFPAGAGTLPDGVDPDFDAVEMADLLRGLGVPAGAGEGPC